MPVIPETPRRGNWITANCGNIYYRPRSKPKKSAPAAPRFPRPLIEPRRTRPQAIHIVTYPSGYVPHDLRPKPESSRARKIKVRAARRKARRGEAKNPPAVPNSAPQPAAAHLVDDSADHRRPSPPLHPVIGKLLGSFSGSKSHFSTRRLSTLSTTTETTTTDRPSGPTEVTGVLPTINAILPGLGADSDVIRPAAETTVDLCPACPPSTGGDPPHHHLGDLTIADSDAAPPGCCSTTLPGPEPSFSSLDSNLHHPLLMRAATDSAALTSQRRPTLRNALNVNPNKRNSLMSVRTAKSAVSSFVTEVPKPVATGSGVACSIILAEPNLFLSGFDHDGNAQREGQTGTALLRGKLQLNVTKNVKIKAVQLKLIGRARTEWPEGIPPLKQDLFEEQGLRTQVLTFFNAMNNGWETEYGNQCTYKLKNSTATNSSSTYLVVAPTPQPETTRGVYTARDLKRLSLQSAQSRSFGKGESPLATPNQVKGFKIFYPGTYDYSFELPIDHHQLETIKLQYGSVRWELHATIDRAGAFKPNLHGMKEVPIVRVPDQMSLEMTEPISISRQWEDQLHYDIMISGKSFPIGSKIPIAFKLTPLAKVQVHKLKVFLTESIEYWTNDRRVTRKDPGRKILLLEKSAGKPLDPAWSTSDLRTVRGGELTSTQRREARELAAMRRTHDATRRNVAPDPLPEPTENLLGDLDLGLECYWGSTEIEANVQIPTCEMMAKSKELKLHPDCSWKNVNVYHWIKVNQSLSTP